MAKSNDKYVLRTRKAADYIDDENNANRGTRRGQRMIESSYKRNGAGRSWLVDKDDVLIAGNHAREAALGAGIDDVIEIEVLDPNVQVVVKRPDLDLDNKEDRRARGLAYEDNRSSNVSLDWDRDQVREDAHLLRDLELFRDDELEDLFAEADVEQMIDDAVGDISNQNPYQSIDQSKGQTLKIVLHMPEGVADVEKAFLVAQKLTRSRNREAGFRYICQFFLDQHTDNDLQQIIEDVE